MHRQFMHPIDAWLWAIVLGKRLLLSPGQVTMPQQCYQTLETTGALCECPYGSARCSFGKPCRLRRLRGKQAMFQACWISDAREMPGETAPTGFPELAGPASPHMLGGDVLRRMILQRSKLLWLAYLPLAEEAGDEAVGEEEDEEAKE